MHLTLRASSKFWLFSWRGEEDHDKEGRPPSRAASLPAAASLAHPRIAHGGSPSAPRRGISSPALPPPPRSTSPLACSSSCWIRRKFKWTAYSVLHDGGNSAQPRLRGAAHPSDPSRTTPRPSAFAGVGTAVVIPLSSTTREGGESRSARRRVLRGHQRRPATGDGGTSTIVRRAAPRLEFFRTMTGGLH